jgi:hypothetical protein
MGNNVYLVKYQDVLSVQIVCFALSVKLNLTGFWMVQHVNAQLVTIKKA